MRSGLRVCERLGVAMARRHGHRARAAARARADRGAGVRPGPPAAVPGRRVPPPRAPGRRTSSRYPVRSVWCDPDDPAAVAAPHPLWSASRPAPARFRAGDYGDGSARPLGDQVRDELADVLGHRPDRPGADAHPVASLGLAVQPDHGLRRLGRSRRRPRGRGARGDEHPVEGAPPLRHRAHGASADGGFTAVDRQGAARVAVPRRGLPLRRLAARHRRPTRSLTFGIDVVDRGTGAVVLVTGMRLELQPVTRARARRSALARRPADPSSVGRHPRAGVCACGASGCRSSPIRASAPIAEPAGSARVG